MINFHDSAIQRQATLQAIIAFIRYVARFSTHAVGSISLRFSERVMGAKRRMLTQMLSEGVTESLCLFAYVDRIVQASYWIAFCSGRWLPTSRVKLHLDVLYTNYLLTYLPTSRNAAACINLIILCRLICCANQWIFIGLYIYLEEDQFEVDIQRIYSLISSALFTFNLLSNSVGPWQTQLSQSEFSISNINIIVQSSVNNLYLICLVV